MKEPSRLGAEIEAAIKRDPRFSRHGANVMYLCCFRTDSGKVFAFERVTQQHINLWLPETDAVRGAAEHLGLQVRRTLPRPDPLKPQHYGRISSLKSISELRDAPLYLVPVTRAGEALTIVSALA